MRAWIYGLAWGSMVSLAACEDVIDINLNESDPKVVIEGEINNLDYNQEIRVSRTVPFTDDRPFSPVSGAQVVVTDEGGHKVEFLETDPGVYATNRLRGVPGSTYALEVVVDDDTYAAESTMPAVTPVDSVSSSSGDFFGVARRALHVHFQDPPDRPNYFRYRMSVNEAPFLNLGLFSDKFNNGRYVTHDLINLDTDIKTGDQVVVLRNEIDEPVHRYWLGVVMLNPGVATPANPPSNISGGALGYFSAQTTIIIRLTVSPDQEDD